MLERQVAEELAGPLAQVARVGPAHVLAARTDSRLVAALRTGIERSRLAAPQTLDGVPLHPQSVRRKRAAYVPTKSDAL
jgi:hypothetical protein